ncbi:MAG: 30S ribosomal protein S16 [Bacteroidota bacterium]
MVKLRLRRIGKKKQPMYKIVAADSRASRTGKFIDSVGMYNPLVNPMLIDVNETRLISWLKRGAQPTDTVKSLLQRKGLWLKWTLVKKGADEASVNAAMEKWQGLQADKAVRYEAKKARRKVARKKAAAAKDEQPKPVSGPPTEEPVAAAPAPAPAPAPDPTPAA